ncbi:MAG: TIM barrel protein, partial [Pseudomonadota bacterium]
MPDFKFSANTGFLWCELPFPERIRKAGEFKFDAVEFHDEAQRHDLNTIAGLLEEHDLPLISMNTGMGENFGTAALPGCEQETKSAIDAAITTAETLGAHAIHVLSGCAHGKEARKTFVSSLTYALERTTKTILIEPIS